MEVYREDVDTGKIVEDYVGYEHEYNNQQQANKQKGHKMKVIKVIQQLQHYVDEHGKNVEVDFKMVAPENISNDDTMDIDIDFVGEIGTSLLPEKVEIGFDYSFGQKDWSHDWKAQLKHKQTNREDTR